MRAAVGIVGMSVEGFLARSLAGMRRDRAIQAVNSKVKGRNLLLSRRGGKKTSRRFADGSSIVDTPQCPAARKKRRPLTPAAEYEQLLTQRRLWEAYASTAIGALPSAEPTAVLSLCGELDRHGCWLEVVRSSCPAHIGAAGIVLAETSRTFVLVGPDGERKSVLKAGSAFRMALPKAVGCASSRLTAAGVLLDGSQLLRPALKEGRGAGRRSSSM